MYPSPASPARGMVSATQPMHVERGWVVWHIYRPLPSGSPSDWSAAEAPCGSPGQLRRQLADGHVMGDVWLC
jgi:hypothetical protein